MEATFGLNAYRALHLPKRALAKPTWCKGCTRHDGLPSPPRGASLPDAQEPANDLPQVLDPSTFAGRVLVMVPHPGEETMGCGGMLAMLAPRCEIHTVLLTNGNGTPACRPGRPERRRLEFTAALSVLGVQTQPTFFQQPEGHVFEHHLAEPGHIASNAGLAAAPTAPVALAGRCRPRHRAHRTQHCWPCAALNGHMLLYYECGSPLPATHVVDITAVAHVKKAALACHRTADEDRNFVEAAMGLNAYRGLYLPPRPGALAEAYAVRRVRDSKPALRGPRIPLRGYSHHPRLGTRVHDLQRGDAPPPSNRWTASSLPRYALRKYSPLRSGTPSKRVSWRGRVRSHRARA